jgi:mono/diheme cytochrome c family protein
VKKIPWFALIIVTSVAGCASGPTPLPDPQSSAAALYADKCGACHAVPHPKRNTAAEWRRLFSLMEQRMAERHMAAFSPAERETLLNYLQSNAR